MNYNNQKTSAGQVLPLLMGCTMPTPIEVDKMEHKIIYDPMTQKVVMDMRVVGTKSLKTSHTDTGRGTNQKIDKKNEIDDSKSV